MARTRRFAKMLAEVVAAGDGNGDVSRVLDVLDDSVDSYLAGMKEAQTDIVAMLATKSWGEMNEEERNRLVDCAVGYGLASPAGTSVPLSAEGCQRGLTMITYLGGLTEDPKALQIITRLADIDDSAFQARVRALGAYLAMNPGFVPREVLADAADRILVKLKASGSPEQQQLGEQYLRWRATQDFPQRELLDIYPFDAPQTPYELAAMFPDPGDEPVKACASVALPMTINATAGNAGFNDRAIADILSWAKRVQELGTR
jgi:hypothetical protein